MARTSPATASSGPSGSALLLSRFVEPGNGKFGSAEPLGFATRHPMRCKFSRRCQPSGEAAEQDAGMRTGADYRRRCATGAGSGSWARASSTT